MTAGSRVDRPRDVHGGGPRGRRALAVGLACLAAGGCGGEDKVAPAPAEADAITAAVSRIVFQCRSVERGFLAEVDAKQQRADVDTLVESARKFDADAPFRLAGRPVDPESTLADQARLALQRLEDGCSPEEAERLRAALDE